MGIASMVLGILAIVVCWIPCVGMYAVVPSTVGIILGGVAIVQAKKKGTGKGCAIAGLVLSIIATVFAVVWIFCVGAAAASM